MSLLTSIPEQIRGWLIARRLKRNRQVAIVEVASRLISADQLSALISAMPDRRLFLEELARELGKPMPILLAELSKLSGVPKLDDIPDIAMAQVLELSSYQIEQFRSAGAAPIISNGKLVGIACIDPATVAAMLPSTGATPLYLACWSAIEQCYIRAERHVSDQAQAEIQSKSHKLAELAQRAIAALVREVHSFGRMSVNIMFEPSVIRYEFTTHEGRRAQGTINPHLTKSLGDALESAATQGTLAIISAATDSTEPALQVQVSGDRSCFGLRWGIAAPRMAPADEALHSIKSSEVAPPTDELSKGRQSVITAAAGDVAADSTAIDFEALVVIVDDNPTFGHVLQRFFARHGCKTCAFTGGAEALAGIAALERAPDLIVSDVHMPQMNGFEFIKRLRFEAGLEHVPVAMLTSDDDAETEIALISGGADAFVAKSEDPRVLWVHVRRLLARSKPKREAA